MVEAGSGMRDAGTADVARAIEDIEEARRSHAEWAEYLRGDRAGAAELTPREETAGTPEHHDRWIAKYDNVLAVLRAAEVPA